METDLFTDILVECPHCKYPVLIEKLNCHIFRHGTFKSSGKQINAHASKELCDLYLQNDIIFGCGKPFKVIKCMSVNKSEFIAVICDYI